MGKNCCIKCFDIDDIRQFITDEGQIGNCDYCDTKNTNICKVIDIRDFILDGVARYYEDAAEHVGFESAEGGYQLPTDDIHDILNEEEMIFSDLLDDPTELLNDIAPWDGTPYVRQDPYGPPDGKPEEIYYWSRYCDYVKNNKRFTLFLNDDNDDYNFDNPCTFIKHITSELLPELITYLPKGSLIYRARIEKDAKILKHKDLTSPPHDRAVNNRMSPAGISFFYGAEDADTCIYEVKPSTSETVVVGKFKVSKNLLVLDLSSEIEDSLSIFNPNYSFDYEVRYKPFLRHFISDIAKPIRASDQHIEYTPTQVFTEFIRSINFKNYWYHSGEDGKPADVYLNGVKFKSSLNEDGVNVVLFRGPEISICPKSTKSSAWLKFMSKKEYIVKKIKIKSVSAK
jgi:hypothetical protein